MRMKELFDSSVVISSVILIDLRVYYFSELYKIKLLIVVATIV